MQRAGIAVLALVAAITAAGCGNTVRQSGTASVGAPASARLLDPAAFKSETAGRYLINVHVPDEGNIEGTNARIPFDRVRDQAGQLPADKTTPIAVYCKSGRMSEIAGKELAALGYTNVIDLRGGMNAWERAGFTLAYP